MKHSRCMVWCAATLVLLAAGCAAKDRPTRQIALTFDDAPRPQTPLLGDDRPRLLIEALQRVGVEAAFFVTTRNLRSEADAARLRDYAQAGHLLANHSHDHAWLRRTDAAAYLADVERAHDQLQDLPGFRPWFRYPFLDEGDSREKRDQVRAGLQTLGYRNGYVTVDNYDWYLDSLAQQAVAAGRDLDRPALRELYVSHLVDAVTFYDQVAVDALDRSPVHVLLLHENDLAALYVDDLVVALEAQGWEIVSPEVAYRDPVARQVPDTLFNGQGRVAAIAHAAGWQSRSLVPEWEDEAWLDARFERAVVPSPVSIEP